MRIPWLQLIHHNVVGTGNLASQAYLEEDLGKLQVEATVTLCKQIHARIEISSVPDWFRRSLEVSNAAFYAVDHIDIRRVAWDSVRDTVSCFVNGRMTAEALTVCGHHGHELYKNVKRKTWLAWGQPSDLVSEDVE